ncbi:MAG: energy-coupling factor transporter transmembrane component T [Candidatus Planktophila sp.]|tara:strand:- start:1425 stop:2171 length:747 start_codon:yes stop_codon:yes gene_type:complete
MKSLHPLTWWISTLLVVGAVIISNKVWLALLVITIAAVLVGLLSTGEPWARTFWFSLKLGAFILVIRTFVGILIGVPIPGTKLFALPILPLPSWLAGIRVGGVVTQERLSSSLHEGLIIVAVISLFGAAVSLTSPHKLLRVTPIVIYEFGVAVVIATTALPQLVQSVARIRRARSLRGDERASLRSIAIPLLEDSLARSLELAAAMDSRGYGVSRKRSRYRPILWQPLDSISVATAFFFLGIALVFGR